MPRRAGGIQSWAMMISGVGWGERCVHRMMGKNQDLVTCTVPFSLKINRGFLRIICTPNFLIKLAVFANG